MAKKGGGIQAGMNKDVLAIGGLLLVLFLIMIIVGVTFIGSGELKKVVCENDATGNTWNGSTLGCLQTNGSSAGTIPAITQIDVVEAVTLTVLGLLSLVVIVGLFAIVIRAALGFAKTF